METFLYLVLALVVVGALAYAVYQVTVRQQRMLAEITRLERLTAEVTMSAEALLDEIDQRMARLNDLAAQLEIQAVAEAQARAEAPGSGPVGEAAPPRQKPKAGRRSRPGSRSPEPAAQPAADTEPANAPAGSPELAQTPPQPDPPADRYGDLRQAVWRLADEGKNAVEIAETLGVPRGEVLLMLNLRGKKAAR